MEMDSLPSDAYRVLLLSVPLIIGGVLHMIAVKLDVLSYFRVPIQQKWFGQNKTWRGFLIMPLATFPGVVLAQYLERVSDLSAPLISPVPAWKLSLFLGLGYCLAELPNSFLKRRLGIKEGQTSETYKWFFVVLDQADSAFGCLFAYMLVVTVPWRIFAETVFFGTALHLMLNVLLYKANIRKNPY